MLVPLWQPDNDSPDSLVFSLQAGEVALFAATGFARKRTRTDPVEMDSPQFACLHRLIFDDSKERVLALEPSSYCDYLYEIAASDRIIYDEPVYVHGCICGLSKCSNTMLWAVPGIYYFHLNDTTSIGKAQVWVEIFKADKLPIHLLGDFIGVSHA